MISGKRLQVLLIAPGCDGQDVGESWSCFQWAKGLADHCDVTLLTQRRSHRHSSVEQLPRVNVVQWPDVPTPKFLERFNSVAKPGYPYFYMRARRWIRDRPWEGQRFDLIHQLGPIALRYPCPGSNLGVPTIIGPLAGSLDTPDEFRSECGSTPWYARLRGLDRWRLRHDRWLRASYASADCIVGVAPYVEELLQPVGVKRFEIASETGVHGIAARQPALRSATGGLRLLYVGRLVRTKGLRDVIRALGHLRDAPGISLDVAGGGEELDHCRREAAALNVVDRVRFHGRIPRAAVEQLYQDADLFVFPSFREPSGNVVFEAMGHGLPVITTNRGGPAYVVDETSGIRLPVDSRGQLASAIADSIRQLADDPARLAALSIGARNRISTIGLWPRKIEWMLDLYDSVLSSTSGSE